VVGTGGELPRLSLKELVVIGFRRTERQVCYLICAARHTSVNGSADLFMRGHAGRGSFGTGGDREAGLSGNPHGADGEVKQWRT
jgi:hypothetical protein